MAHHTSIDASLSRLEVYELGSCDEAVSQAFLAVTAKTIEFYQLVSLMSCGKRVVCMN